MCLFVAKTSVILLRPLMKTRLLDNDRIKRASQYLIAALLCFLILFTFYKLWRADMRVPFQYNGDALLHAMFIRGIIDNGWYWQNPSIGAPNGLQMYDFPAVDNAGAVVLWFISIFTHDAFRVLNIFFLLTFPLVTIATLYVLRRFNVPYVIALVCSLLYAFLPFHFMRNESHLFLSAYYLIPLAAMVVLWVAGAELSWRSRKFMLSAVICVVVGSSGIYYPFFTCYLLLVAGALAALRLQKLRPLAPALVLVVITSATVLINLSPSLIYIYRHGNAKVVQRGPAEAEFYGLKISALLLPITGHRIKLFDRAKRFHNSQTLLTENDTATLGIVGTIGFFVLLAQLLRRRDLIENTRPELLHNLSVLNIFAVLLGTVGGFGFLFAVLISSSIRSYTRISLFIAFFSLLTIAVALEWIQARLPKAAFYVLLAVLLVAGILDQTTRAYVPDYSGTKADFLNDEDFVKRIEASLPPRAMIFQLPYVPFPEHPKVQQMVDYDHFRGYLHSRTLRWSYGTIKNRDDDLAQQRVAALAGEEFVQSLAFAGFSGVYLDRHGYEDGGAAKEAELSSALQSQPIVSGNGRLLFFNLTDYAKRLREKYSESEWAAKQEFSFHPLLVEWKGGFSGLETDHGMNWHWSSAEGELLLRNTSTRPRKMRMEMSFATGHEQMDDLFITGLVADQLKISSHPTSYVKDLTIPAGPAGESVIHFRCTAPRVNAPRDPRVLVFRVENFKLTDLE